MAAPYQRVMPILRLLREYCQNMRGSWASVRYLGTLWYGNFVAIQSKCPSYLADVRGLEPWKLEP